MDKAIFQLIDQAADRTLTNMTLVTSAIAGAYAQAYRSDPSIRGLRRFMAETTQLPATALDLASVSLSKFENDSLNFRTAYDPMSPGSPETLSIALQQLRVAVESVRLASARRFRAALVSRTSIAPAITDSVRVLNRAGRQIQASEMLFTMARKAAIDIFNEAQVDGLRSEGQKTATVYHKDDQHQTHGMVISIDDSYTGIPAYADVQNKWFHPRSNAVIGRTV